MKTRKTIRRPLRRASKLPLGVVLYRGSSLIDGAPIVVIATGIKRPSQNDKTGEMVQIWYLREDISPFAAIVSGDDASICGDCKHRGVGGKDRTCYVNISKAPRAVWEAYHRGAYEDWTSYGPFKMRAQWQALLGYGASGFTRFGAYGDPASAPASLLYAIGSVSERWTGYTHQWQGMDADTARQYQYWLMASVDSDQEAKEASARGWRYFRVGANVDDLNSGKEILCPASEEAGKRVSCAECTLCSGTSRGRARSVFIPVHGSGASNFEG